MLTEPKVVLYDSRGNLAGPGEEVFVHVYDYDALAARVRELESRLAAYTPLPSYNVIHSKNTRLLERVRELEAERVKILGEGDSLHHENAILLDAISEASVPLEALFSTECDEGGSALSAAMKLSIFIAVTAIRNALEETT